MTLRLMVVCAMVSGMALAQQPIGTVGVQDATVAGALVVTNGRAVLVGSTTVTARDHSAEVALERGGTVQVCATSGLHLTSGKNTTGTTPLMLALDRGAIEVQMKATTSDVVMTPDLRFTMRSDGPLNLRLRVTSNGDTCVENRGANAPVLRVMDPFGGSFYELRADQHVMFEHASLKEVVDNESSPCGCPPVPVVSVADAGVTSSTPATPGSEVAAKTTPEQHPFPAAVSDELAPAPLPPQTPPGVIHIQVATTLSYDAGAAKASATDNKTEAPVEVAKAGNAKLAATFPSPAMSTPVAASVAGVAQAPLPPSPPAGKGVMHSIGHFFKRLFGRH
jgi:hypothetical protein